MDKYNEGGKKIVGNLQCLILCYAALYGVKKKIVTLIFGSVKKKKKKNHYINFWFCW